MAFTPNTTVDIWYPGSDYETDPPDLIGVPFQQAKPYIIYETVSSANSQPWFIYRGFLTQGEDAANMPPFAGPGFDQDFFIRFNGFKNSYIFAIMGCSVYLDGGEAIYAYLTFIPHDILV